MMRSFFLFFAVIFAFAGIAFGEATLTLLIAHDIYAASFAGLITLCAALGVTLALMVTLRDDCD